MVPARDGVLKGVGGNKCSDGDIGADKKKRLGMYRDGMVYYGSWKNEGSDAWASTDENN